MSDLKNNSVLIVGAGISGLTLGYLLSQRGFSVTILEKSAGVGGRIATRRGEGGHWNHGIPWLSKSEIPDSLWNIWSKTLIEVPTSEGPQFVSPEGLTQIAKLLAKNLTIHKKSRAIKVEFLENSAAWTVTDDSNTTFSASALVLTCPIPQTVELLSVSGFLESSGLARALAGFRYRPHLVGLANIKTTTLAPGEHKAEPPFELVTNQDGFFSFYMDVSFSSSRWSQSDEEISKEILGLIEEQKLGKIQHFELKRWRYSRCENPSSESFLKAKSPHPLFVIGDAFSGGSLKGAIHSAFELADTFSLK